MRASHHRILTLAGLVFLALPTTGCLRLFARDVEPAHPDRGIELAQNPYEHRNAPEYSRGRIYGFRELYTEAEPFADAMAPVAPLPAATASGEPVEPIVTLPADFTPVAVIRPDMTKLREGRSFDDVTLAASAGRGTTLSMPTEAMIALKAPADRRGQATFLKGLLGTEIDGVELKELATVEIVDAIPAPMTSGELFTSVESNSVYMVAPAPPPPPPPPPTGTLPLTNVTTSYAFITVNGQQLGQVPPLAKARIEKVKSGIYDVGWELPNGFTWNEKLATRNDLGPKLKIEGDHITLYEKVFFDSGRDSLQRRSIPLINELAETLLDHDEILKIRIEGHTDSDGDETFNQDLSSRRAKTVARALVARGVDDDRMETVGFGESKPIAPNTDAAGKAANRRVVIDIIAREEGSAAPPAGPDSGSSDAE